VTEDLIYKERVSSNKTEMLFVALTLIFLLLLIWHMNVGKLDVLTVIFSCLSVLFLFYSVNYRILTIHLTSESLKLAFGIYEWVVAIDNIEECRLDNIPMSMRMGGAGIHFMSIRKRYRASFNFLEHPRVVIAFKRKEGPVRDISFSTRRPNEVLGLIQEILSVKNEGTPNWPDSSC
jgi:hypothetical protein